jgi:Zn ribbon nucleic-acid-binding protein
MRKKITKTSKNTNCLRGMKCPECGQEDSLKIQATCIFTVTDDGTEDEGYGHDWKNTSYCECPDCGHHGTVADFTIEE